MYFFSGLRSWDLLLKKHSQSGTQVVHGLVFLNLFFFTTFQTLTCFTFDITRAQSHQVPYWKAVRFDKYEPRGLRCTYQHSLHLSVCLEMYNRGKKIHPFPSLWYEIRTLWPNIKPVKSHTTAFGFRLQTNMNQIFQMRYCAFL